MSAAVWLGQECSYWRHAPEGVPPPPLSLDTLVQGLDRLDHLSVLWVPEHYADAVRYIWVNEIQHGYIMLPGALAARPQECKWMLAHEAGHHYGPRCPGASPYEHTVLCGRQEWRADYFGAGLLVPRWLVGGRVDVPRVAEICGVDERVVQLAVQMRAQGY